MTEYLSVLLLQKSLTRSELVAGVTDGMVTGKSSGTAMIKAITVSGKTAECSVTVKNEKTDTVYARTSKITIMAGGLASNQKATKLYLLKGKKITIEGTVAPANAEQGVTYSTTKKGRKYIVLDSKRGTIKAKKVGKAVIIAKSADGKASKQVIVNIVKRKKADKLKRR